MFDSKRYKGISDLPALGDSEDYNLDVYYFLSRFLGEDVLYLVN